MNNEIIISVIGVAGMVLTSIITKKRVEKTASSQVASKVAEDAQRVYQKMVFDLQAQNQKLLEDRDYYLSENIRITKENQELRAKVEHISNEMQKLIVKVELFHDQYCQSSECKVRIPHK